MMFVVYIVLLLLAIQLYKLWKTKVYKYRDLNIYPGPSIWNLCQNIIRNKSPKETFDYITNLNHVYGPVVKLWLKPFEPVLQVTSTAFIDQILLSKTHVVKTDLYDLLDDYVGQGIGITHSANLWKKYRTALNPSMKLQYIHNLSNNVFDKNIDMMINILAKNTNKPVNLDIITHLFALDTIFETCFGHETNFQCNENRKYLEARIRYFDIIAKRMYALHLKPNFIFNQTNYFKELLNASKVLKKFQEKILSKIIDDKSECTKVLSCLLQPGFTKEEIDDNLGSMILGGHDTVGTSLSFCLFEIANRPELQDRLFKEILEATNGEDITLESVRKLKLLESVVKETLRFYNVVPFIERQLQEDIYIDGVKIVKGTQIRFNLWGIHKSEKYFQNPEIFDPDRFLRENSQIIDKNTFMAFSVGPRDCIGRYYAMTALKQCIAKVLQRFQLKPVDPKHNLILMGEIVIRSLNGVPVIIDERNNIS